MLGVRRVYGLLSFVLVYALGVRKGLQDGVLFYRYYTSRQRMAVLLIFGFLAGLKRVYCGALYRGLQVNVSIIVLFLFLLGLLYPFSYGDAQGTFSRIVYSAINVLLYTSYFVVGPYYGYFPFVIKAFVNRYTKARRRLFLVLVVCCQVYG